MKDADKTKEQLIDELVELRRRSTCEICDFAEKHGISLEDIRRALAYNRGLIEASVDPMITINPDGKITDVNISTEEVTGKTREKLIGTESSDYFSDPGKAREGYKQVFLKGIVRDYPLEIKHKNGKLTPVLFNASVYKDGSGNVIGILAVARDITQIKAAEKELRKYRHHLEELVKKRTIELTTANEQLKQEITERKQAEETTLLLSSAVEQSTEGIAISDLEGNLLFVNRAFAAMHGCTTPEELIGKHLSVFHTPEQMLAVEEVNKQIQETGEFSGEIWHIRRDGTVFLTLMHNSLLRDEAGNPIGMIGTLRDITERKRMEEEVLKAQKLESISVLASGIAHDFNNILTGILGNISLARMYTDPNKASERLEEAEKASFRAKDLTQKLLSFSRGGAPIKKTASIANILRESAAFALSGSDVRCAFFISDDLWPVEIDEGQMNQVISNLVINADQAMPEGGVIELHAENAILESQGAIPLKTGEYVKISLADQGIGISKGHIQKIFDPFFTTKQKGDGLGLATSYSIIKNHGGHITAESQVGIGTTFHVYLPVSPEKILIKKKKEDRKLVTGERRVLAMDNEEFVRELLSEILTNIGYGVTIVADGAEAIELYQEARESGKPFDAVIMDLTIPDGMGGKETVQRLIKIDPEVKAIVSSGYSNDPIIADFKRYGFKDVIAKPYRIEELSEVLRKVIMMGEE